MVLGLGQGRVGKTHSGPLALLPLRGDSAPSWLTHTLMPQTRWNMKKRTLITKKECTDEGGGTSPKQLGHQESRPQLQQQGEAPRTRPTGAPTEALSTETFNKLSSGGGGGREGGWVAPVSTGSP